MDLPPYFFFQDVVDEPVAVQVGEPFELPRRDDDAKVPGAAPSTRMARVKGAFVLDFKERGRQSGFQFLADEFQKRRHGG